MSNELEFEKLFDDRQAASADRQFRSVLAQISGGLSPVDLALATIDWIAHLGISPGKRAQLVKSFIDKLLKLGKYSVVSAFDKDAEGPASAVERRMSGDAWQKWPFKVFAQAHQSGKDWAREAAFGVEGVRADHEILVHAVADQILDMLSPANTPLTNPEVIQATIEERGKNLFRGLDFFVRDNLQGGRANGGEESSAIKVGRDVGLTPGKVVFQNELIELIQYKPATETVGAEPVLICPAWIMKYYILDLSPHNSLAKYLIEQGKTVFMVSWKNPDEGDRDVCFDDYINDGLMAAIDAVNVIVPKRKIHAVGYCLGGTLLAIGASAMARDGDDRLASISLFAAQADFSEAGEIMRFISPSQLSFLDKVMRKQGYLGSENMGGAFASLRSSDLVYAGLVERYFFGKKAKLNDLMSWNADGTRMPYRMHKQYLEELYLQNLFARNKFKVGDRVVSMSDIRTPMFVLGTETDHVAPWRSVFKIHDLTQTDLTFLLTSGGHNAGVVSGPQHPRRHFRVHTRKQGDKYRDPDTWLESLKASPGSWWPTWNEWVDGQMSSQAAPPAMGARRKGYKVLRDAPGEYVFL